MATGHFADGTNEALKVLEQAPDNGDAIITLTEAARSKEDIEAAEEQLQKFPKKNDVSFYLASANLFFSRGDLAAAVNALQQALAADPKSSAAHMAHGKFVSIPERPETSRRRIQESGRPCAGSVNRAVEICRVQIGAWVMPRKREG